MQTTIHGIILGHEAGTRASAEGPTAAEVDARRRQCIQAAGNCCSCMVVVLFIVLLLTAPDAAIFVMIVCMGLFFSALIINQIRARREAYLNAHTISNAQQGGGRDGEAEPQVTGYMYNQYNGAIVPIMQVVEGDQRSNSDANAGNGAGGRGMPGVALYQASPTQPRSSFSNGPYQCGQEKNDENADVRQDGDAIYGRAQYLSAMPLAASNAAGCSPTLQPDYVEVHDEDKPEDRGRETASDVAASNAVDHHRGEAEKNDVEKNRKSERESAEECGSSVAPSANPIPGGRDIRIPQSHHSDTEWNPVENATAAPQPTEATHEHQERGVSVMPSPVPAQHRFANEGEGNDEVEVEVADSNAPPTVARALDP